VWALLAPVVVAALVSCLSVQSYNSPTVPGPQWKVLGGSSLGYAVTLPNSWAGFDLATQVDAAVTGCSPDEAVRSRLRQTISALRERGVRLFACDAGRGRDPRQPVAFAISGASPPEGLDAYLAKQPQAPGREIVERRHLSTNAGDMVLQRIRERLTAPDGTTVDTTQLQFLVIRFSALHILIVEYPSALEDLVGSDAASIGGSFTPLR
jgi:hypothetical protein